ncbi:MAG: serine/threonine protein kinase [Deltaproteobacteria bacterium]|nr:serine/threonine protein kinase [Deltaproteobacteria bacterium]
MATERTTSEARAGAPASTDAGLSRALGELRPAHDVVQAQLFASVTAALFGAPVAAPRLGPYTLVDRVGAGGMGTVFSAWDDRLERRVALKVLHRGHARARADEVLREARALARVIDPHVVPVYDTGRDAHDDAWIAMEFVAGTDLRVAARREQPTAVVLARWLAQALAGVLAAHAAGILHGDLKPENLLRGDDGRVRVVDFGMAVEPEVGDDARGGTRGFLAPELIIGGRASAASDLYAFAVTAEELRGEAGLHRWPRALERALRRARARDPARRGTAGELAVAIGGVVRRDRDRRGLFAVLALGVVAGVATIATGDGIDACARLADDPGWEQVMPRRVAAALARFGAAGQRAADDLAPRLQDTARSWHATRELACASAPARRAQLDACLRRSNRELQSLVLGLETASSFSGNDGARLGEVIGDPARCDEGTAAPDGERVQLHEQLLLTQVLLDAGDFAAAEPPARAAWEQARRNADAEMVARAAYLLGRTYAVAGPAAQARELLERAYYVAEAAALDDIAADATIVLMHLLGGSIDPEAALGWRRPLEAELARAAAEPGLEARARVAIARAAERVGDLATMRVQARELLRMVDDGELDGDPVAQLRARTLYVTVLRLDGDVPSLLAQQLASLAIASRAFRPDHPDVGITWVGVGSAWDDLGDVERAIAAFERGIPLLERAEVPRQLALALYLLGRAQLAAGRLDQAQHAFERSAAIWATTVEAHHPDLSLPSIGQAEVAHARGDYGTARRRYHEAIEILGPDDPTVGWPLFGLGETEAAAGDAAAARLHLRRAREHFGDNPIMTSETWFAEGKTWAREGQSARARQCFAAASAAIEGMVIGPELATAIAAELAALP